MANIPIWPGSSSFSPGDTPRGLYDTDTDFQTDADKVANFCARRLGYPLVDIELQDLNFYTAFEEAVTTYGNELYAYKIREDYLSLEGAPTSSTLNNSLATPSLGPIIRLSEQYGTEAGVGGNVDYRTGSFVLTSSVQDYDFEEFALANGIEQGDMEIRKVFYEASPAIERFYDPFAGTGYGFVGLMDSFGFGGFSPAVQFLMMPLSFDMGRMQQIEMADQVRRSNYTFQIKNNKLKIFPIPKSGDEGSKLFFEYILKSSRLATSTSPSPGNITNVSNVPYTNPVYTQINSVGRQWIFEYTLALSKEMLGYVRGKYSTIPIPDSNVTLNQSDLIAAATSEKNALIEKLRGYFDETSRKSLLERKSQEGDFKQQELNKVPMTIFIG
jgi:hypothetical protein